MLTILPSILTTRILLTKNRNNQDKFPVITKEKHSL